LRFYVSGETEQIGVSVNCCVVASSGTKFHFHSEPRVGEPVLGLPPNLVLAALITLEYSLSWGQTEFHR
jgi:hypothetical protein